MDEFRDRDEDEPSHQSALGAICLSQAWLVLVTHSIAKVPQTGRVTGEPGRGITDPVLGLWESYADITKTGEGGDHIHGATDPARLGDQLRLPPLWVARNPR